MIIAYPEQESLYKTNPVASVILCAHNHLNDLTIPCIESIRSNTLYPYEMILVDDGSNDGSIRYFRTITQKAIRVPQRSGCAKARNAGLEAAAGDPLVILDNDTMVPPEWLTILVEEAQKPGVGVVSAIPSDQMDRLKGKVSPDGLIEYAHVTGFCTAITRRCLDAVGYFDESLINNGEDTDFCYRARERGFRIANTPRLVVQHRGGGTRRELDQREIARSARRFVQKHGARNPDLPTPPLYPFG